MIVRGYELMQMIVDGKLKDGEIIYREGNKDYKYIYKYGNLYWSIDNDKITEMYSLKSIMNFDFEISEDTTKEIEELYSWSIFMEGRKADKQKESINNTLIDFGNKINELVRAYNKLNNTTYKAENCMTD